MTVIVPDEISRWLRWRAHTCSSSPEPLGVGKTTLLLKVAATLGSDGLAGFTTEEIREHGERVGFRIVPLGAAGCVMARVDFRGPQRVGRYGVDVAAIDAVASTVLTPRPEVAIYLVDEIGKMECLSQQFVAAIRRLLDSKKLMIASIARAGTGFIAEVKRRSDVELWEVTVGNRDTLVGPILRWIER